VSRLLQKVRSFADRLVKVDQEARDVRTARDTAIRQAASQHSEREIAEAARISGPAVHRIIARRAR
jgi:hypothetical protein